VQLHSCRLKNEVLRRSGVGYLGVSGSQPQRDVCSYKLLPFPAAPRSSQVRVKFKPNSNMTPTRFPMRVPIPCHHPHMHTETQPKATSQNLKHKQGGARFMYVHNLYSRWGSLQRRNMPALCTPPPAALRTHHSRHIKLSHLIPASTPFWRRANNHWRCECGAGVESVEGTVKTPRCWNNIVRIVFQ
jgi:hypothetical protein